MPAGKLMIKADEFHSVLRDRFAKNMGRHQDLDWADVQARLERSPGAVRSLLKMEATEGEPDVIARDQGTGEYLFCDCSPESPEGRRNVCYDLKGYEKRRREGLPVAGSALGMAAAIGIEVLEEEQYWHLQTLGTFDSKSQSWLKAPEDLANLGGGIFGDRRFGRVFVYHNTPHSFYRVRGFRGVLKV